MARASGLGTEVPSYGFRLLKPDSYTPSSLLTEMTQPTSLHRPHRKIPQPPARRPGRPRIISLGEGNTPLIRLNNIPRLIGKDVDIYVKYEGLNPTGSFKDRGMTMAVTKAVEAGVAPSSALPPATPRPRQQRMRRAPASPVSC